MQKKSKLASWKFDGPSGEFILVDAHKTNDLYFPLANEFGMMSSITPILGGDSKSSQNTFLMEPVSSADLRNSSSTRNFWVRTEDGFVWSAAGNSLIQKQLQLSDDNEEKVQLRAGFLYQKINRENKNFGISSEVVNFVPVNSDKVELMKVTIKNIGNSCTKITPTAAIPIYGRSADNIRDHRHVTSLLHRITTDEYGVVVNPTLTFDERGHKPNSIFYSVHGVEENGNKPIGFFPVEEDFIGEGGSLLWPEAVVKDSRDYCETGYKINGYEAIGAIRFKDTVLEIGESKTYVIIMGISEDLDSIDKFIQVYGSAAKFDIELQKNQKWWESKLSKLIFKSSQNNFDLWMKWVELQPILRRIYGCSFLPHHDYGRGGRGWRDLWQDCLALLLLETKQVRKLLLNNYGGVRFDGSNATIIGSNSGEFIADRNNIARTWMDHGAWPYFTTKLYLDLSGDLDFLLEKQVYFKDRQCSRSKKRDDQWTVEYGSNQKDDGGKVYRGTILEHILLEQITVFYNVGEHNNIKLEGADWNDAFDMGDELGESVAFTAFYGSNLIDFSRLLLKIKEKIGIKEVEIAREIIILLDSISGKIDYNSVVQKNTLLDKYFATILHNISGEKVKVKIDDVAKDLEEKGQWIIKHIRESEWIKNKEGYQWFNGYYDNAGRALEGDFPNGVRMTLIGQVFTIMGEIADEEQVRKIIEATNRYLKDETIGGIRLNTDFKEIKLNMGRCFGFAYGHKENGAMFSHMTVMYINALYKRGFVKEGYEILKMMYEHSCNFERSRIYPGIPEYFNERGRGMYNYLTGSASWLLLSVRNEVYGVKGDLGDLVLEPKLVKEQFDDNGVASVVTTFRDREFTIIYKNKKALDFGEYKIRRVTLNNQNLESELSNKYVVLYKEDIDKLPIASNHTLIIELA